MLRGALATGGQLPNFLGVLAGVPRRAARLRALSLRAASRRARRSPRSSGSRSRSPSTTARSPGVALHSRTARRAGLRLDEVALAREFDAATRARPRCCATSRPLVDRERAPPMHLHEEAREAGWTDEQILEAIAVRRARELHRDGQRRGRRAGRRLRRGDRAASRSARRSSGRTEYAAHMRGATAASAAVRSTTRRSSSSAGAGRARSSACSSMATDRCASGRSPRPSPSSPTACCPSA